MAAINPGVAAVNLNTSRPKCVVFDILVYVPNAHPNSLVRFLFARFCALFVGCRMPVLTPVCRACRLLPRAVLLLVGPVAARLFSPCLDSHHARPPRGVAVRSICAVLPARPSFLFLFCLGLVPVRHCVLGLANHAAVCNTARPYWLRRIIALPVPSPPPSSPSLRGRNGNTARRWRP